MEKIIEILKSTDNYRELHTTTTTQKYIISGEKQYINFSSNDYLGLGEPNLQNKFLKTVDFSSSFLLGTPSSRLMTGNNPKYDELERIVAQKLDFQSALVLGSGFLVNSGVLPAITQPDDLIIADKLVHASLIDGLRLCKCKWLRYRHNDVAHLRQILEKSAHEYRNIYVVTESVFSMDGDCAPLQEIVDLKREFGFKLYLDEAHAFGVLGSGGMGLSEELGLLKEVDYYVATFGKAIASQGAFVACDSLSRELLVNKMRTLIYSTALPPISLMWSAFVINNLADLAESRKKLVGLSVELRKELGLSVENPTHIVPIVIGNSQLTVEVSKELKERGFWVTAIRTPTVVKGSERLRVSLNSHLEKDDVRELARSINELLIENGIQL